MTRPRPTGFTLLEVLIAMAILAVALVTIFNINATSVATHAYTKKLTVAALLARSKMTDIEQELYDQGFSSDDDEDAGDFSDDGWPTFRWRAKIIAPRTTGLTPDQALSALIGIPLGGGSDKDGEMDGMGLVARLFGGGGKEKSGGALPGGAGGMMAGLAPALLGGQFGQMVDMLGKSVREVHLTVSWKDGKQTESLDLVTHVVAVPGTSDRNGSPPAGDGTSPAAGATRFINARTRAPVANPVPGPNGKLVDPASPQDEVIPDPSSVPPAGVPGQPPGGTPGGGNPSQRPLPGIPGMEGVFKNMPFMRPQGQ